MQDRLRELIHDMNYSVTEIRKIMAEEAGVTIDPRVQFLLSMFNIEHDTCSTLEVGQGKCSKYEHASCSTMLDMTHVQQLFKLNMHPVQLD